ncbi:MAG: tyrosine-type recombinase/integrase [Hyphomicrobiales bacterium]|nr:tyrosine-type recombinase/integrase [Hyphomicrobiales bacterium]
MAPDSLGKLVRRLREGCKLLGFSVHPHMLRHGCGFALANAGHDTRAIQDCPGHTSIYQVQGRLALIAAPACFWDAIGLV